VEPGPSLLSQYGVVGVIASIFAAVIVFLFKQLREEAKARIEDHKKIAEERAKHDVEREALRTEFERKHRELVEVLTQDLRDEHKANRAHEDEVRKEFAELMETVSAEAAKSSDAIVSVLNKFYDRWVGPGPGPGSRRRG
jgi:hypothetical protein